MKYFGIVRVVQSTGVWSNTSVPSPCTMPAYTILPATPHDIPALTEVYLAAFKADIILGWVLKNVQDLDLLKSYMSDRFEFHLAKADLEHMQYIKIVDETDG